jgi:hypothetical protein
MMTMTMQVGRLLLCWLAGNEEGCLQFTVNLEMHALLCPAVMALHGIDGVLASCAVLLRLLLHRA